MGRKRVEKEGAYAEKEFGIDFCVNKVRAVRELESVYLKSIVWCKGMKVKRFEGALL